MVPDLEANKFTCHSFMDTERRQSEKKDINLSK